MRGGDHRAAGGTYTEDEHARIFDRLPPVPLARPAVRIPRRVAHFRSGSAVLMDSIKHVSAALVKAQQAFGPALKSSSNPHFKSKYADLAACVEAVIEGLNSNGIALIQKQHPHEGGVAVETIFVHESGETLSAGVLTVPAAKQDPQGYGSALTYARRYSLMAACGIAPEDDDGNAASKPKNTRALPDTPHSGPAIAFAALSPDWQAWINDLARDVQNTFEQAGPAAAQDVIDAVAHEMEAEHRAALWSKLDSKTRSALKTAQSAAGRVKA